MKKLIENLKEQLTELNSIVQRREQVATDNTDNDFPDFKSLRDYESITEELDCQAAELCVLIEELQEINNKIDVRYTLS